MVQITQSLLKQYIKVAKGMACPMRFDALYIAKTHESVPSPAMALGHFFEYEATGQLPRNKEIPKPILLKSGSNAGQPNEEYRKAIAQAKNWKADLVEMGFEIIETGYFLKHPMEEDVCGTVDVLAKHPKYGLCLIDLKYSGLINDKWHELGWAEPGYKPHHMIQAVHYNYLKRIPFFFAVYSSANDWERKWFFINIDPAETQRHAEMIKSTRQDLKTAKFPAMPTLAECQKCEVQCKFRAKSPEIERVDYPQ